jgi:transcriptional regulator with XRE-family HTH domain
MTKRHRALRAFGKHVREIRRKKHFTQEGLAGKAGLDLTYISALERGCRNPTLLSVILISKALGMSVSQLTRGIGA